MLQKWGDIDILDDGLDAAKTRDTSEKETLLLDVLIGLDEAKKAKGERNSEVLERALKNQKYGYEKLPMDLEPPLEEIDVEDPEIVIKNESSFDYKKLATDPAPPLEKMDVEDPTFKGQLIDTSDKFIAENE